MINVTKAFRPPIEEYQKRVHKIWGNYLVTEYLEKYNNHLLD